MRRSDQLNTDQFGHPSNGSLFNLVDTSLSAAPAHLPDPWSSLMPATIDGGSNNNFSPQTRTYPNTNASSSINNTTNIPIDDPWSTPVGGNLFCFFCVAVSICCLYGTSLHLNENE